MDKRLEDNKPITAKIMDLTIIEPSSFCDDFKLRLVFYNLKQLDYTIEAKIPKNVCEIPHMFMVLADMIKKRLKESEHDEI